jgi:hypothetical protein
MSRVGTVKKMEAVGSSETSTKLHDVTTQKTGILKGFSISKNEIIRISFDVDNTIINTMKQSSS